MFENKYATNYNASLRLLFEEGPLHVLAKLILGVGQGESQMGENCAKGCWFCSSYCVCFPLLSSLSWGLLCFTKLCQLRLNSLYVRSYVLVPSYVKPCVFFIAWAWDIRNLAWTRAKNIQPINWAKHLQINKAKCADCQLRDDHTSVYYLIRWKY